MNSIFVCLNNIRIGTMWVLSKIQIKILVEMIFGFIIYLSQYMHLPGVKIDKKFLALF